ncbi:phosphoethanolamine transferase [Pseudochrobactrum asaccharolyticum]|jgi:lipid A ethanolaminephosphotransferase|uniref:Phosphatidylethanolamine:Kdo2-lipid A phosphoethanolamine transferase n=1 Tax=Pseudochrobactrum asaccharolyticum TaxID=354351 RepID=A0A366E9C4_9HYPH|nr:phosphoethanolamine--lipid A transferase [Pseudochrobactrum asaccharolyticum]MDR2311952.1 phosphoethanolamine--lipid A transferase [Brucellaceae bacterium]RBO98932.1 phosphatidylethanolamine:Kdo2-lipid A phosphoethanolamine transferase [Pseudochrobactrum asaccharolyticum]
MKFKRISVASNLLCFISAIYIAIFFNRTVFAFISDYLNGDYLVTGVVVLAIFLLTYCLLVLFSAPYLIKPALIFFIAVSASSAYFIDHFGVFITPNMIENAATTTRAESGHLINGHFILSMLLYAGLPSALIFWVKIKHRPFTQKLWVNTLLISGCLIVTLVLVMNHFGTISSMFRDKKEEIVARINPLAPVSSSIRYLVKANKERTYVAKPLGTDAVQLKPYKGDGDKKRLTVIVVGETARAQSFSFNGYAHDTNPQLRARDVLNFSNTTSCGTETAVSVPCMFSPFPRADYSSKKFRQSENLMDVLNHAGLQPLWIENNTGTKRVADRIETIDLSLMQEGNPNCEDGECYDQVLVDQLAARMDGFKSNTVVVLHMLGSHGPAYYRRYPADAAVFKPACNTSNFSECTQQEIINAYDNTILYTDKILAEIIDLLKSKEGEFASSMIYMSDHGESLGEKGLYLHGMPYFIAPREQTSIPFFSWFSPDFLKQNDLDMACLRQQTDKPTSHDDLFNLALGLMDVKTSIYDEKLDIFNICRSVETAN